jgi:hypothetical protein
MDFIRNAILLLARPRLARGFLRYEMSKILHRGTAVRKVYEGVEVTHYTAYHLKSVQTAIR